MNQGSLEKWLTPGLQLRKVQVDPRTSCARKQGTAQKEGVWRELSQKEWEPAQLAALGKLGQFNYWKE